MTQTQMSESTIGNINPLYASGEVAALHADLFPAAISPMPEGIPKGVKLRAIITERGLTLAWQNGSGPRGPIIHRMDIPMTLAETAGASFRGGVVGTYNVVQGGGCNCGARAVRNWAPFPGATYKQIPRQEMAVQQTGGHSHHGVPPARYSRSRL